MTTLRTLAGLVTFTATLQLACAPPAQDASDASTGTESWSPSAQAVDAADQITAEQLRAPIAYLSSDELGGRGPASEGDLLTQRYLAEAMEGLGLEPGFADGWTQSFGIVGITSQAPDTWTFHGDGGPIEFAFWDEFIAASGVQTERSVVDDAEVVFVGYGIQAPEYEWDDYKGVDLTGKVLLMLNNDPDWDADLFEGTRRLLYGRWTYKYESAARQGAVGAIIIHTTPSAGYPYQVVQTSWTGEQFELPDEGEPRSQIEAWLTEDAAARLVAHAGHDLSELVAAAKTREFEPVPLGVRTSLCAHQPDRERRDRQRRRPTARLRSGELANEVVVFTAHHDHLGTSEPDDEGDAVYNGALDNASGVSQVLAAASAYAALPEPPRRSLLFLFVGAEEQGLLGSAYYALYPSFAPGRISANVNIDGGNIWGRTRDLTYIGHGKSSLGRDRRGGGRPCRVAPSSRTSFPTAARSTARTSSTSPRSASRPSTPTPAPTSSIVSPAGARSRSSSGRRSTTTSPTTSSRTTGTTTA